MESPRFPESLWKPGLFINNCLRQDAFEVDIHLVDGGSCLTVTITIGVDHTDLTCTMKFPAKKKKEY